LAAERGFGKGCSGMKIIETTEMDGGGLRITVEIEAEMLIPLAALGIKYAVVSAAMLETGGVVEEEPDEQHL
jgi:hypothetical protein